MDETAAEEFVNRQSGDVGGLDALGNPEELWSGFKTTVLDVAGGLLGTHCRVKKNFVFQGTLDTIDQSRRAGLFRKLRCKTVRALRADKEAYVRQICRGVEHHLWSSDSRPAYRGIHALRSSKPVPWCTAVRAEDRWLMPEESEVKACWVFYFERLYQADPPAVESDVRVLLSLLLTLQSTAVHLRLWKHRLR